MSVKFTRSKHLVLICLGISLSFYQCKTDTHEQEDAQEVTPDADRSRSTLLSINGELFSIPSPIQTALLIKENGLNYNKEMLNSPKNASKYAGKFNLALNLGVYGADLGYVTIYDQTQDALSYLSSVKQIADQLDISNAFDKSLADRFEKNIGNKDSILVLVSDAYRASDDYLKNNERGDLGALVLAGGMIESLYFATTVANESNNQNVIDRIGEQKRTVENLVKLMSPYYEKPEFTAFVNQLVELSELFEGISYNYVYSKPTVDIENMTTTINSKTEVKILPEQLKSISSKIETIRNLVIG